MSRLHWKRISRLSATVFCIQIIVFAGLSPGGTSASNGTLNCTEGSLPCADNTKCFSDADRCDSLKDCDDGSDEVNCGVTCMQGEFYCSADDECFSDSYKCDGQEDCSDSSDEADCANVTCPVESEFLCQSDKTCIVGLQRCDGIPHCHDGSDEQGCHPDDQTQSHEDHCDSHHFDCYGNGTRCILLTKHCDGHEDCIHGEDELMTDCATNSTSPCSHDNGGCSHYCVINEEGHHCECPEGFEIDYYGRICEGEEPELWVNNGSTLVQHLLHSEGRRITSLGGHPTSVAYDYRNGSIFWIDSIRKVIFWSNKDKGGTPEELINTLKDIPVALAFDWIHGNLYWADAGHHQKIEVITIKNKWRYVILNQTEVDHPKFLAVDPRPDSGYVYWAQGDATPVIRRAGLDGSEPETIISTDVANIHGLALDLAIDRLFWLDSKLSILVSLGLSDHDREVLTTFTEYPRHPIGLAVFEDNVYWADADTKSVFKMYKHRLEGETTPSISTVLDQLTHPTTVEIYHELKQPQGNSYCGDNNGGCSHICLPSPHHIKFHCVCPISVDKTKHFVLDPNDPSSCQLIDGSSVTSDRHNHSSSHVTKRPAAMTSSASTNNIRIPKPGLSTTFRLPGTRAWTPSGDTPVDRNPSESEEGGMHRGGGGGGGGGGQDNMWILIGVGGVAGLLIILLLSIIGYKLYARHVAKNLHFDNPVFEQKPLRNSNRQADSRA